MCDYSIINFPTRDARAGDRLTLDCLGESGSRGFVASGDEDLDTPTVVCVKFGTELTLSGIPEDLQARFGVGDSVTVTFDKRTANTFESFYRDGVLIPGYEGHVSLQELPFGLKATVEYVPSQERSTGMMARALELEAV